MKGKISRCVGHAKELLENTTFTIKHLIAKNVIFWMLNEIKLLTRNIIDELPGIFEGGFRELQPKLTE